MVIFFRERQRADTDMSAKKATKNMQNIADHGVCSASPCSRLLEARDIIQQLLNAIPTGHCADFHHGKKDQHGWHEPCPVEKRWRATIKRSEDFVSSANSSVEARRQ